MMLIPASGATTNEQAYIFHKDASMGASYAVCGFPSTINLLGGDPEESRNAYLQVMPNHSVVKTGAGFQDSLGNIVPSESTTKPDQCATEKYGAQKPPNGPPICWPYFPLP